MRRLDGRRMKLNSAVQCMGRELTVTAASRHAIVERTCPVSFCMRRIVAQWSSLKHRFSSKITSRWRHRQVLGITTERGRSHQCMSQRRHCLRQTEHEVIESATCRLQLAATPSVYCSNTAAAGTTGWCYVHSSSSSSSSLRWRLHQLLVSGTGTDR